MARAILILAAALLAGPAAAQSEMCAVSGESAALIADAVTSPFFAFLSARSGPPADCTAAEADGTRTATFSFPNGSELSFTVTEGIEASAYELRFPVDAAPVPADAALALAEQEAWLAAPDGCGLTAVAIATAAASADGTAEIEGDVCNCRATVTLAGGAITGLSLGLAC